MQHVRALDGSVMKMNVFKAEHGLTETAVSDLMDRVSDVLDEANAVDLAFTSQVSRAEELELLEQLEQLSASESPDIGASAKSPHGGAATTGVALPTPPRGPVSIDAAHPSAGKQHLAPAH